MQIVFGFEHMTPIPRGDGLGFRVGMPMVDQAEEGKVFLYPPVVRIGDNGRLDGQPLLCAMCYDSERGWQEKQIDMGDPDLYLTDIDWDRPGDCQLIMAQYKGQSMCLSVMVDYPAE